MVYARHVMGRGWDGDGHVMGYACHVMGDARVRRVMVHALHVMGMGMGMGTGKGDREVDVMFGTSTFMLSCVSFVRFPMSSTSLSNHSVCGISGGREAMSITWDMDKESRERWR